MAIEASGLLHASYLIQYIFAAISGRSIESNEHPGSAEVVLFFWFRIMCSTLALTAAIFVTIVAILEGKTTMFDIMPPVASLGMTLGLWLLIGILEGTHLAVFAAGRLTIEERRYGSTSWSQRSCRILLEEKNEHNLANYMLGRQLCVTAYFFAIARATTMHVEDEEDNVMGVHDVVQTVFNTGILGAFITTIIASLMWQFLASAFPLTFLATPLTHLLVWVCLLVESTGICQGAWVLATLQKKLFGFRNDEKYIGTAQHRAEMAKE